MQRLKDMRVASEGGSSDAATLVAMVATCEPLVATAERRERVLARVLERPRWRRSLVGLLVRPAFAVAVLLLVGITTAAATVAPRLQSRPWGWLSHETSAPVAPSPAAAPARVISRRPARAEVAAAPAPHVEVRAARPHARALAPEDPSRIVEAVHALRSEDDPARAEQLALDYLRVYPRGALTEEALAVAIEAGARRQDPRTGRLADRYLRTYPDGRFRRVAEQALQRTR